jgi:hypothetical protein
LEGNSGKYTSYRKCATICSSVIEEYHT